jgi:hypothetical protein
MMRSITATAILSVVMLGAAPVATGESPAAGTAAMNAAPVARSVTIPAGTVLRLRLTRGFGSDISRVEDTVSATLASPVVIGGRTLLPTGSVATGYVSEATRPGKVKGRGRVAVRFTRLDPAGHESYSIRTRPWVAVAPATKKKDALTIGIPAAGGAAVGALIDGKKGAGIGAAIGGGAGTATVLTTRGKDVRIGRGATISVRLSTPLTVEID